MKNWGNRKKIALIIFAYSAALLAAGVLAGDVRESLSGLVRIVTSPAQLTLDYFKVGTVGGTFLNAGLVGLSCGVLFLLSGFSLNGVSLMAFFLSVGFSFFGMNILNIWPSFLGTWLFSRAAKLPFAGEVNVAVFSTALSPFVSEILFRHPVFDTMAAAMTLKIALAVLIGAAGGFLMPILCRHSPGIHKGYSLYNAAAVAGFVGVLFFALLFRATGNEIPSNTDIGGSFGTEVTLFSLITSALAAVGGFLMNGKSLRGLGEVFKSTGYRCDFTQSCGVGCALMNIGIFGLFVTGYYHLTGAAMTGPTAGCILCLLAVAPCGAHILNMLPIMAGYALATTFCAFDLSTQAIAVGLCFAGALVPISGRFGALSGVAAGLIHACLVTTAVTFHGGFCLYNGGFTSGITALLLAPVLEFFFAPSDRLRLLPGRKAPTPDGKE